MIACQVAWSSQKAGSEMRSIASCRPVWVMLSPSMRSMKLSATTFQPVTRARACFNVWLIRPPAKVHHRAVPFSS